MSRRASGMSLARRQNARYVDGSRAGTLPLPPLMDTLALWLDPTSSSTSVVDGAVAVLGDNSGNARHATQGMSTRRPAWNASDAAFGGRPSFTGDGIDNVLPTTSWTVTGNAITYYFVMRGGGGTANANERFFVHDKIAFRFNTTTQPRIRYVNTGTTERQITVVAADPKRLCIVADTTTPATAITACYVDGSDTSTSVSALATVSGLAAATLRLLAQDSSANNPSDATIACVLAYHGAHTAPQVADVDAWLAARYGL